MEKSDRDKPHPPNWCEKLTLFLEVCGIVGLAIYCIYTYKEWKVFDAESKIMVEEFKASQANAVLDQRAWVAPVPDGVRLRGDKISSEFSIPFRNTGRTPAMNFTGYIELVYQVKDVPKEDKRPTVPGIMLAPDGKMDLILKLPGQISNYENNLYFVYGTIWYDDFAANQHWMQFCYAVKCDTNGAIAAEATAVHNGWDNEKP